jgi:hypothetical protein
VDENERVLLEGDADEVKRESARRTRRGFLVGGVAAAAGYGVLHWINHSKPIGELPGVFRKTLQANANVDRALWDESGLAPVYPLSHAKVLRLNGVIGLDQTLKPESWRLQMVGVAGAASNPLYVKDVTAWEYQYAGSRDGAQTVDTKDVPRGASPPDAKTPPTASALNPTGASDSAAGAALAEHIEAMMKSRQVKRNEGNAEAGPSYSSLDIGTPGLLLTMDDLMKLPKVSFCTEFKCIEGWSEVAQWSGVRLRDLMEMYPPEKINGREPRYVYMETPDGNYYTGYNLKAVRHPQSLLVTEMGGQPLTQEHGAPLRLHMPIKYGYKQIKRIGLIAYTDQKPDDYWMKLGYDWYAGI